MASREGKVQDDELVPVKVKGQAYRLLKTVSAWRGQHISDYVSELVMRAGQEDLAQVLKEIQADVASRAHGAKR